jgi:hypothetical protein
MPVAPDPDDARVQLDVADQARERLTTGLRLPGWFFPTLATAVAVQVAAAAVGIALQSVAGLALVLAGLVAFMFVAALEVRQFHRHNGVRVDGLTSQIVLGTGGTSTLAYLGAFALATVAAFQSVWWLVAVSAVAGGAGYSFGVRQWWQAYRRDPADHASGPSARLLAVFVVLAVLGVVALVVAS